MHSENCSWGFASTLSMQSGIQNKMDYGLCSWKADKI